MTYKQVVVEGKGGISAKIVLDSVSAVTGSRMVTYEIECHRFIWAEMLTHKMLSRNAASSRAIPTAKMFEQCRAQPISWAKNKSGMQAGEEFSQEEQYELNNDWWEARDNAVSLANLLLNKGVHKQWVNRLSEPFQMMKAVVSGTEWDNFFWLRNHEAAQPEIYELARCMLEARKQSEPQVLQAGEWHLPMVEMTFTEMGKDRKMPVFWVEDKVVSVEDALKVSAARCAAVSFRNSDYGLEKSREVWERLVGDERKHSSAMEHQVKVMLDEGTFDQHGVYNVPTRPHSWEEGVSHADRQGNLWSGNLKGFIQLRKLIEGECCNNYEEAVRK